jgi:hypothetical protein
LFKRTQADNTKTHGPFDFAEGRLSTPQIIAFAMISSGRDDKVGMFEVDLRLKPLFGLAVCGTAKAVPFPIRLQVYGYVVMPEHVHLLFSEPQRDRPVVELPHSSQKQCLVP